MCDWNYSKPRVLLSCVECLRTNIKEYLYERCTTAFSGLIHILWLNYSKRGCRLCLINEPARFVFYYSTNSYHLQQNADRTSKEWKATFCRQCAFSSTNIGRPSSHEGRYANDWCSFPSFPLFCTFCSSSPTFSSASHITYSSYRASCFSSLTFFSSSLTSPSYVSSSSSFSNFLSSSVYFFPIFSSHTFSFLLPTFFSFSSVSPLPPIHPPSFASFFLHHLLSISTSSSSASSY